MLPISEDFTVSVTTREHNCCYTITWGYLYLEQLTGHNQGMVYRTGFEHRCKNNGVFPAKP